METTDTLQEWYRDMEDFHTYAMTTLMPNLNVETMDVPSFHWQMYKDLDQPLYGQTRGILIVAPVGFSKSTILKIWGVYQFLWRIDPYILYVSSTVNKSTDQFGGVTKLINDKGLQAIFGYKIIRENTTEILIKWDNDGLVSKFEAIASGQDISGKNFEAQRPSLILVDDIEEIEQARNAQRTDDLEDWVSTTLASRLPTISDGRIRMIGTVFNKDSLANRILGRSEAYGQRKFIHWASKIYQALDSDDNSIWESRHPANLLMEIRDTDPKTFAANYMNEPLDEVIVGAYYQREIEVLIREGRYGDQAKYDPNKTVDTWWDEATSSDLIAVWFTQKREDGGINFIDYWEDTKLGTNEIAQIINSKPYVYSGHYGPHDLMQHQKAEETIRTKFDMYRASGIHFFVVGRTSVESGRNAVRVLFPRFYFDSNPAVAKGFNHLKAYRSQVIPNTGGLVKEVHDIHSHCSDAIRILAVKISLVAPNPVDVRRTTLNKLREQVKQRNIKL